MSQPDFKPVLGWWDATMIVAGSMIGSGIFIVSADITRHVGSAGWLLAVWGITGFMTITAAVSYGELSGMFPKAGGQYVYLKEAYNPLVAFLYGWSLFGVIQTGTIAAVGVAFAKFTAYLLPYFSEDNILFRIDAFSVSAGQMLSIGLIAMLTFVNSRGVEGGKRIQTFFTSVKLLSLFMLIVFGLALSDKRVWNANWSDAWSLHALQSDGTFNAYTTFAAMGAVVSAMVGAIFSSDAWNNVTFIAKEIRNPQRNIGLSLFLGAAIVIVIYLLTNLMYTAVLPMPEIASADKDRVAAAVAQNILGDAGMLLIAVMIMISAFGCANGMILTGARVLYTMAKDGLFFPQAGHLNRFAVPAKALWIQFIAAGLLCVSGRYGDILDMISFVVVIFYVLTIAGIFILRKTRPEASRPYLAFGYPWLPGIYIIMGTAFCVFLILFKPAYTIFGLMIALAGVPVYYRLIRSQKAAQTIADP